MTYKKESRVHLRGFASQSPERRAEIARKGGAAVPAEKRSFSQNRKLAREAGRKGGKVTGRTDQATSDGANAARNTTYSEARANPYPPGTRRSDAFRDAFNAERAAMAAEGEAND